MYIPPYFRNENFDELFAFMQANAFAIFTCNGKDVPLITHLPFLVEKTDSGLRLSSHLAAINPHAKALEQGCEVLVVFSGPHAYISPSNYEKKQNVPTWNYIAVHARGQVEILPEKAQARNVLENMINAFEPAYFAQWQNLDEKYIDGMIRGILAFEIEVTHLEGKYKLSQNKTANERKNIVQSLSDHADPQAAALAQAMNSRDFNTTP
ncbi:MAG: FMN-binding negative transcriptional regulator [Bacteroidia bacterium]